MKNDYSNIKEILNGIIKVHECTLDYTELKDLFEEHENCGDDFYIELDGMEFRVIADSAIWDIYVESIQEITEDCYLEGNTLPSFLAVDWEQTAKNCYADGYGHNFSGYDGSEITTQSFWIFRNN